MTPDGRWEPLTAIAQALALVAVLVGWWRHDRKRAPEVVPSHTFREVGAVTGPRPFSY